MPDFLTISRYSPKQLQPTTEWLNLVATLKATPPAGRKGMLVRFMLKQASLVLVGADASQALDPRTPLDELGFNSLMAVELANRLGAAAGVSLSVTLLFNYPTIDDITDYFLREVIGLDQGRKTEACQTPRAEGAADGTESLLDAIERLSDEEVGRLSAPFVPGREAA